MNPNDAREYAQHPDRQGVRLALESMQVDPTTDTIVLFGEGKSDEHRDFPKGDLRNALAYLPLNATTVIVMRNGQEAFREADILDLFGCVYF